MRVEEAQRVRPIDSQDMLDTALAASPDGGGFPGAASIHHNNRRIVKARVGIGAERVRKMVIDETKPRPGGPELLRKWFCTATLVPHANEVRDELRKFR